MAKKKVSEERLLDAMEVIKANARQVRKSVCHPLDCMCDLICAPLGVIEKISREITEG